MRPLSFLQNVPLVALELGLGNLRLGIRVRIRIVDQRLGEHNAKRVAGGGVRTASGSKDATQCPLLSIYDVAVPDHPGVCEPNFNAAPHHLRYAIGSGTF